MSADPPPHIHDLNGDGDTQPGYPRSVHLKLDRIAQVVQSQSETQLALYQLVQEHNKRFDAIDETLKKHGIAIALRTHPVAVWTTTIAIALMSLGILTAVGTGIWWLAMRAG